MFPAYTQKQSPAQKKDAPSAASVLDASSQGESLQRKADLTNNAAQRAEASRPNNTGMPDNLKAGIESLSGFSMDDVRVHYNSSKPATVQALAYTQGTDIHVAPGQEKCLPHEAWHVAQQMAGRVSPTTNVNGMPVNDNAALEHEADVMGEKAVQCKSVADRERNSICTNKESIQLKNCIQRVGDKIWIEKNKENGQYEDLKQIFYDCCCHYIKTKKIHRKSRRLYGQEELKIKRKEIDGSQNPHSISDPLIFSYEQSQIDFKLDIGVLKNLLSEKIEEIKEKNKNYNISLNEIGTESLAIKCNDETLLNIWVNNDRFDVPTTVRGAKNKIYHRKGDDDFKEFVDQGKKKRQYNKEYILTANNCYVPRYVYRNLNSYDKNNLTITDEKVSGINTPNLCDVDSRNPIYFTETDENFKKYNIQNKPKESSDSKSKESSKSFSDQETRKNFLGTDINEVNVYFGSQNITKKNKLKKIKKLCAKEFLPDAEFTNINYNDGSDDKEYQNFFISLERIGTNVDPNHFVDMKNFFNQNTISINKTKVHFWTAYNSFLKVINGTKTPAMTQAILDHQRFKEQQGGSGFVSCTATKHPIFGSTGQDFYQAPQKDLINAVAKIDLAKIDSSKIYSTYSKKAMESLYGSSDKNPSGIPNGIPQYGKTYAFDSEKDKNKVPQSMEFEINAAARDAMRTREIIIDGPIPKKAIVEIRYNNVGEQGTFEEYGESSSKRSVWTWPIKQTKTKKERELAEKNRYIERNRARKIKYRVDE